MLDLRKGDHREEFREQEVAGKEQTECTHVETDLPDGRSIIGTPGRGQVVTVYRSYDDHKTFEPHTDIHEDGHEESHEQVSSHFAEPEDLGRQYVTTHHQPVAPAIGTVEVQTVLEEGEFLIAYGRVPGHEQLGEVGNTHDRTGEYDYLIHHFNVLHRDIIFEGQYLTCYHQQGLHHCETGEDRTRNEVGREDRRMPAGNYGSGEVEGYDCVHG